MKTNNKTINSFNLNFPLIPNLKFSICLLFSLFAMVGMTQTYEIGTSPTGDNMVVAVAGSGANVLMDAGWGLTTGIENTIIGSNAGQMLTTESANTLIGKQAGFQCKGERNTVIGAGAANGNSGGGGLGSDNVIIGHQAGWFEYGDHKLYIANTATGQPLIYGEFDNALAKINGTLHVKETLKLIPMTTEPPCTSADKGLLYMNNGTNKLRLCDGSTWADLN